MKTAKKLFGILGVLLFLQLSVLAQNRSAQEEHRKDKEIHIELRTDAEGASRVFKRDYGSREEMLADQELKDFLKKEDLQAYFFGRQEQPGFHTFRMPGRVDTQLYFFKSDSLKEFKFKGDTSYSYTPDFSRGFAFPFPRDPGVHFWLPFHSDSMYTMPLKPWELDSVRKFWEVRAGMANGGYFYGFGDEPDDVHKRLQIIRDKKVSISALKKGEEVLFGSVKAMDELVPDEISYFPNPGSGRFTLLLELKSDKPLRVSILDINGKAIYEEEVKIFDARYRKEFDLREKEEGMYLLRVVQGNKQLLRKIILN